MKILGYYQEDKNAFWNIGMNTVGKIFVQYNPSKTHPFDWEIAYPIYNDDGLDSILVVLGPVIRMKDIHWIEK